MKRKVSGRGKGPGKTKVKPIIRLFRKFKGLLFGETKKRPVKTKKTQSIVWKEKLVLDGAHSRMASMLPAEIRRLVRQWNGHPNLKIRLAKVPFIFTDSQEKILVQTLYRGLQIGKEIELYGVVKDFKVSHIEVGGEHEYGKTVFAIGGTAYHKALKAGGGDGRKIMLGHTHPRGYGPIFSHVEFGGEYAGSDHHITLKQPELGLSPFHFILAIDPTTERPTIGVWSAGQDGIAIAHPCKFGS